LFLQARENWKKSGNLYGKGKSAINIIFEKVRENDLGSCRVQTADICDFFASPNIEKQAYLRLPLNV